MVAPSLKSVLQRNVLKKFWAKSINNFIKFLDFKAFPDSKRAPMPDQNWIMCRGLQYTSSLKFWAKSINNF